MSANALLTLRTAAGVAGTAVTATSATSLLPEQAAQINAPAEYFVDIGQWLHLRAGGVVNTPGSPGTLTFSLKFGSVVVFAWTSPTLVGSLTNLAWNLDVSLMQYVIGNASALRGRGFLLADGLVSGKQMVPVPSGTLSNGNTFDPSNPGKIDFLAHFSAASHSITLDTYAVQFAFG